MPIIEDLFAGFAIAALLALAYYGTRWVYRQKPISFGDVPGERGERTWGWNLFHFIDYRPAFSRGTTRRYRTRSYTSIDNLWLIEQGRRAAAISLSGWRPIVEWMRPVASPSARFGDAERVA